MTVTAETRCDCIFPWNGINFFVSNVCYKFVLYPLPLVTSPHMRQLMFPRQILLTQRPHDKCIHVAWSCSSLAIIFKLWPRGANIQILSVSSLLASPQISSTGSKGVPVDYPTAGPNVEDVIQGSVYCSQSVEYQCQVGQQFRSS